MRKENQHYFKVVAKCGHVGRNKYIPIQFAVIAENASEAAQKVRYFPRVKHDHKDAILLVERIRVKEYKEINRNNRRDPYLQCHSKYEQDRIEDLKERLIDDLVNIKKSYKKSDKIEVQCYKQKKLRLIEKCDWEEYYENNY